MRRGDTIGHYTIESPIGSGGMGDVFLATDDRLQRKVAIKIIQRQGSEAESQESAARLLREARAAASLTHPNVVSVFDVGEHEGRVYLAMEYVVGKTLREYVAAQEPHWTRRVRWLLDVARALAAAHKKGLVHRDIKPENVMVRDEDGLVKVLDFGIARRVVSEVDPNGRTEVASLATLTGKGQIIGTPMYMAPEQIKGTVSDARSDQFAWGVVAFELLAGRRPWPERSDLLAAVALVLTEEPASLRELAPDLPDVLVDVVHRALAREPSARFSSMDEIAELIESHAAGSTRRHDGEGAAPKGGTTKKSIAAPEHVEVRRPTGRAPLRDETPEKATTRNAMVTERSLGAEPPPPEPPRRMGRRVAFALGVIATVAVGYGGYRYVNRPLPTKPTPVASADAGSTKPPSDVPEANVAFSQGMQFFRDGSWRSARRAFESAERADPGYPAPSLMLALLLETSDESGREAFNRAMANRARLSIADHALLESMDPVVLAGVPDYDAAERRAKARVEHAATDSHARFWLGWVREQRSDFEGAVDAYEQAIALDPALMPARRGKARALLQLGRSQPARAELDECLRRSRAAAICLRARLRMQDDDGDCAGMERDARDWGAIEPENPEPEYHLAAALAAEQRPKESVEEALRRQWIKMSDKDRARNEPADRADLAIFFGDFGTAERAVDAWEKSLPPDANVLEHAAPTRLLVHLAFEAGDVQRAADIAKAFEDKMAGLPQGPPGTDPSLGLDEFLYRAQRMRKIELEDRRRSWLERAEASETQREKTRHIGERWAAIYAGFAETPEEAKEALAIQERFEPMPPKARETLEFAASVGKAYALANKPDEAIPLLERVTRSCSALRNPLLQTRAFYFLGQAREAKGDAAGARAAFNVVIERWAKVKSTTVDNARQHLNTLHP